MCVIYFGDDSSDEKWPLVVLYKSLVKYIQKCKWSLVTPGIWNRIVLSSPHHAELSGLVWSLWSYTAYFILLCVILQWTEIPSKINTGGEAHDRPAHPLHKPSEVAPEKLHQRLMWPLMFKKVHAKDCRAEEKQHWAMYYFLQQASKQIKWALEDICLLFPAHTALFCFIARELHGWCHFFSEENRPPEPFTDIINYL